jgi:homoserine O-acetyltransferase/O-succinyltransferase
VPGAPASRRSWATLPGLVLLGAACGPGQQVARLGDLPLESGQVVRDCRLGYRTFGGLDAARSNAVLLIPWFLGRSAELARHVGPGRLVDSRRYFVVVVDSIGGGVSTSPSNSEAQPGPAFPRYTVRDMVEAQHRLLTAKLGIAHLRAVVGTSLGGMQVFQWMTAHPGFMDKAVTIAGSPRISALERRRWLDEASAVQAEARWRRAAGALRRWRPQDAFRALRDDPMDHARQAEAVATTDVSASYGGSLERAATAVRTRTLVVVSERDETVDPGPAMEFARLTGARLLVLDGRCGHDAPACEKGTLWPAVDRFLAE